MPDPAATHAPPFSPVLARNIETLVHLRQAAQKAKGTQERIADAITRFTGSMAFVYIHLVLFGSWITLNLPATPVPAGLKFDPSFVILAMAASVEAIFLSTFVLISQNRLTIESDKRAELDLQITLLTEHELTQAVKLLDAIAQRLGVDRARDAHADPSAVEDSKTEVDPKLVLETIEQRRREAGDLPGGGS